MIEIKNGKVYIEGKETTNPELIGNNIMSLVSKKNTMVAVRYNPNRYGFIQFVIKEV